MGALIGLACVAVAVVASKLERRPPDSAAA
jgi:hypothetical protein